MLFDTDMSCYGIDALSTDLLTVNILSLTYRDTAET